MIQTTFRLPDELYKTLKAEARKRGMTMNAYLISVLWQDVKKKYKKRES